MNTAIIYFINKRTREWTREEMPEKRIRNMKGVERLFDFMITGNDDYHKDAALHILDGFAVYRLIEKH